MNEDICGLRSAELFDSGLFCAESVLKSVLEQIGTNSPLVPRIATGFCSGIARSCGMCGAVSGGILGIGAVAGRDSPSESVNATYEKVGRFLRVFEQEFGSTNCRELIGCDLGTAEGQRYFRENNLRERCRHLTEQAARMVARILA